MLIFRRTLMLGVLLFLFAPAFSPAVPAGKTLTWEGGGKGTVTFDGKEHAEKGHGCDVCHPGLFQTKKGTASMTMEAMNRGEFCGACHNGTAAFGTRDPKNCHECHKAPKSRQHDREKHQEHDKDHHDQGTAH